MIIVSGCSYACGEWARGDLESSQIGITHAGLSQYIKDAGYPVTNLGIPSGSNLQICAKIQGWIDRHPDIEIKQIIVFQTEYTRDWRMRFDEDYDNLQQYDSLRNIMIARFYNRLIEIAKSANCQVQIIGGASDTLDPDLVKTHYDPIEIVCQSMTNLVINNEPNLQSPVFSWYHSEAMELVKEVKSRLPVNELEKFLQEIDRGAERENLVFGTPEYFWPDGVHANRKAHRKLFDFLMDQRLI